MARKQRLAAKNRALDVASPCRARLRAEASRSGRTFDFQDRGK